MKDATRVLQGRRFDVYAVDSPAPDGKLHRREIVVHPGAVVVLGLLAGDRVLMIRNKRIAVGDTLLELPAGTLEPPEEPIVCAGRELIEETGYRAKRITPLTTFFTSPGICTETMYAFLAEDLTEGAQDLDEGEEIVAEPVKLTDALDMIRRGIIRDGKTIATLLYYDAFVRNSR